MKFKIKNIKMESYEKIYLIILAAFCCLNQILYVAEHRASNIITMILALLSVPILMVKVFGKTEDTFSVPVNVIGLLLAFTAVISLIINKFSGVAKNIYGIFSILINFLILFDYFRKNGLSAVRQIVPVLVVEITALCLVSDFLLFSHVSLVYDNWTHWIVYDPYQQRFCGITGNPNSMAMVAFAGAACAALLFIVSKKKLVKISTVFCALICLYTLFLTESRGMIYSFYFGIILAAFAVIIFRSKTPVPRFKNIALILLIAVFIVVISLVGRNLIFAHIPDFSSDSQESSSLSDGAENDESQESDPPLFLKKRNFRFGLKMNEFLTGRDSYWKNGINATLRKHPIFGLTPANAGSQIMEYVEANQLPLSDEYRYRINDLHNHFVQTFAYYGLAGLAMIITLWLYHAKVFCKLICRKKQIGGNIAILSWCTFAIGSLLLHGMVEAHLLYTFDSSTVSYIFIIALGLAAYASNQIDPAILKDGVLDTLSCWIIKLINLVKKPFCKSEDNGVSAS